MILNEIFIIDFFTMKFNKCCFCCSIKTGAYVIGCLHVFGLLTGILMFKPMQIALDIFCGGTFLAMVYRDNAQKRMYYLAAYCCYILINNIFVTIFIANKHDEQRAAIEICTKLNETPAEAIPGFKEGDDIWEATEYDSLEDCE